jgi:ATP-dependent exoDNAse (exonuclease V) beta subunit
LLYLFSQSKTLQPTLEEVLDILEQYALHPNEELPVKEELSGEDAVQIMTVFASKGLEFKVVFAAYTEKASVNRADDAAVLFDPQYAGKAGFGLILGKVNGLPNLKREVYNKCWQTPRGKTEAQRVFYVALTRAMERLYVIRGSQSFPWTSPDDFPKSAVQLISETHDAAWLDENFWNAEAASIRQRMIALQEHQKAGIQKTDAGVAPEFK